MHTSALLRDSLLLSVLFTAAPLWGAVQLASPFGDHMVLQCDRPVPVWGTADAGETITVEFAGQRKKTTAAPDGRWRVTLNPMRASSTPRDLVVTSSDSKSRIRNPKCTDVLVGEVWLCGGQSNMERQLGPRPPQQPIVNWEREVAAASHPQIRQLHVRQARANTPQGAVSASWTVCSPETVEDFTAVGYFFARDLHAARGVPVGIIHSSWGGSPAEVWMSSEALAAFPEFADAIAALSEEPKGPDEVQREYAEKLAGWFRAHDPASGEQAWSSPEIDTSGWETIELPAPWETGAQADFDGVAWCRKSFDLPEGWSGRDLELRLGVIDDSDTTWINGVEVGSGDGWMTPRVYRVPAHQLQVTGNVIVVRVLDTGGAGGIWNSDFPLEVVPVGGAETPLSLRGSWQIAYSLPLADVPPPPTSPSQGSWKPTTLYNAMIAPLVPYAIRGATFYQGESNAGRARQYRSLFPAMIADWRGQWQQGDFPFLFVQIAPYRDQPPEIREAQLLAWQATKNTSMVVTLDCGDEGDIHPANKEPVGERLALAARAVAYGEMLEYSGPVFDRLELDGSRAVLHFTHVGGGLVAPGGPLEGFTVAGADGVFMPAHAAIAGATVVVTAADVPEPRAVRYAWANFAQGNLFNRAGLPASPFRTDVQ